MAVYTRKRHEELKSEYSGKAILLESYEDGELWTYDKDAELIAKDLGAWCWNTKKGKTLVLHMGEDIEENRLRQIQGETGAFIFKFDENPGVLKVKHKALPASALARVTLSNEAEERTCVIVGKNKEKDPANGIYWCGRPDYQSILYAIYRGSQTVELGAAPGHPGEEWSISSYELTKAFSDYSKKAFFFTDIDNDPKTVYICEKLSAVDMEEIEAAFYAPSQAAPLSMTVYLSPKDGKYYLLNNVYEMFRRKYGLPYVRLKADEMNAPGLFMKLKKQSELFLYGYTVSQEVGLSVAERQRILKQIIDERLLKKQKVEGHLNWLINTHGAKPSMMDAVAKWKTDLLAVTTWHAKFGKKIWIKTFGPK